MDTRVWTGQQYIAGRAVGWTRVVAATEAEAYRHARRVAEDNLRGVAAHEGWSTDEVRRMVALMTVQLSPAPEHDDHAA